MAKSLNVWITIIVSLVVLIAFIVNGAVNVQKVSDKATYTEGRLNSLETRIYNRLDRIENLLQKIHHGN